MFILPYEVRTLVAHTPWTNLLLVGINTFFFAALFFEWFTEDLFLAMVLASWHPMELLGHQFLHADGFHFFFNMLALWVFGNAVCGVMNNWLYLALYLLLGFLAGAAHLLLDGAPAIGASGAICGVIGIYIAIYPLNRVHCIWVFLIKGGTVDLPGWLIVGGFFLLDLLGVLLDGAGIAYWAHIGGTVAGFAAGLILLKMRLITIADYDNPTIPDLVAQRWKRQRV